MASLFHNLTVIKSNNKVIFPLLPMADFEDLGLSQKAYTEKYDLFSTETPEHNYTKPISSGSLPSGRRADSGITSVLRIRGVIIDHEGFVWPKWLLVAKSNHGFGT